MKERWEKLRVYGWYALGTLVAVDAITFASLYVVLSSGVDVIGAMRSVLQRLPMNTESVECKPRSGVCNHHTHTEFFSPPTRLDGGLKGC